MSVEGEGKNMGSRTAYAHKCRKLLCFFRLRGVSGASGGGRSGEVEEGLQDGKVELTK